MARRRREAQQEFLYTMPIRPQAGQICELYYNPDLTPLRGRPEIYVRGAFNRWQHPNSIPPTQMKHGMAFGVGFMKTQIQVGISVFWGGGSGVVGEWVGGWVTDVAGGGCLTTDAWVGFMRPRYRWGGGVGGWRGGGRGSWYMQAKVVGWPV